MARYLITHLEPELSPETAGIVTLMGISLNFSTDLFPLTITGGEDLFSGTGNGGDINSRSTFGECIIFMCFTCGVELREYVMSIGIIGPKRTQSLNSPH